MPRGIRIILVIASGDKSIAEWTNLMLASFKVRHSESGKCVKLADSEQTSE